jgi:hypothetical protein
MISSSCRVRQGLLLLLLLAGTACGAADSSGSRVREVVGVAGQGALPDPMPLGPNGTSPGGVATGAGGGAGATQATTASGMPLPCDVAAVVAVNCQKCHGATPIGGAPMSLMTYDDFHRPGRSMPALAVYQLAQQRINNAARPMPPGGGLPQADFAVLNGWLAAGAIAGTNADKACAPSGTMPGTAVEPLPDASPLVPEPGETCYDLRTHASTASVDDAPYVVDTGEHYEQFYFEVPWKAGDIGTRFGAKLDNLKVLHHWLLFTTIKANPPGFHETVIGTQLGDAATLIAGWAVGGWNVVMPDDVGFDLPPPGTKLNVQWHYFNNTGAAQADASAVQVCTRPAGSRPKLGSITWLGSEFFNGPFGMPAGQKSDFSGTCKPSRAGMNATDPIHIFFFWPHMHNLGVNMRSIVNHADGSSVQVFDKPFDFNHQIHYAASVDLAPGDTITSTCGFNNTTTANVPFGPSTTQEMCYQFTFAYPTHALDNGVLSLIGATNTCW